jgi:hypothetical protein
MLCCRLGEWFVCPGPASVQLQDPGTYQRKVILRDDVDRQAVLLQPCTPFIRQRPFPP